MRSILENGFAATLFQKRVFENEFFWFYNF